MYAYTVEPLYIPIGQEVIAADFYRPKNLKKPAVIIMAHDLLQKSLILKQYRKMA